MKKILAILGTLGVAALLFSVASAAPIRDADLLEKITGKTVADKAELSANEIARLRPTGMYVNTEFDVRVQIVDVQKKEGGGIEVFARAWKGANQLGLGGDHTVDIERFVYPKPRLYAVDPAGELSRDVVENGRSYHKSYTLDPVQALRDDLAHTISLVGKTGTKIVPGSIGSTTSTFYPDPAVEVSSVDGYTALNTGGSTWAALHDNAGSFANDTGALTYLTNIQDMDVDGQFRIMMRGVTTFDTAGLDDTETISSATLSHFGSAKQNNLGNSLNLNIYTVTTASATAVVAGDYNIANWGSTALSTTISYLNWSVVAYNDFALNATGIAAVSKTGVTYLGTRNAEFDAANSTPATSANSTIDEDFLQAVAADTALTTTDPKLVVVSAAASVPGRRGPAEDIFMSLHDFFFPFAFAN